MRVTDLLIAWGRVRFAGFDLGGDVSVKVTGPLIDTGRVDLDGFDRALGDPADPVALLSYARSAELDGTSRSRPTSAGNSTGWGCRACTCPPSSAGR